MPAKYPIPFSVLDLSFVREGEDAGQAIRDSLKLAQHVEQLGYHRFWLAEHHNMAGIASAATSVVIGFIANGTSTIRVGAGGVMLPNHSPLVIAEQFGTLESLYPGRIDLGLGRAPGTDMSTSRALRRQLQGSADSFPEDVQELISYFEAPRPGQSVHAHPGEGLHVPVWLLGSSTYSARLAAALGLPFAFASHFAPTDLMSALEVYRRDFQPSDACPEPYCMAAVIVFAADTDDEARRQFTSSQLAFLAYIRGRPGKMRPPVDSIDGLCTAQERAAIDHTLHYSFVGSPGTIQPELQDFIDQTGVNELIVTGRLYDQEARLRSFELLAELQGTMGALAAT
jgi:luciferase family oxidoreductase group 1